MNIFGNRNSDQPMSDCSMHPIDPVFFFPFAKGGRAGIIFFWVFVVPHVLSVNPSNSQSVPLKFPMGSTCMFPLAPHFVPYALPKMVSSWNLYMGGGISRLIVWTSMYVWEWMNISMLREAPKFQKENCDGPIKEACCPPKEFWTWKAPWKSPITTNSYESH